MKTIKEIHWHEEGIFYPKGMKLVNGDTLLKREDVKKLIEKKSLEWAGEDYDNWKGYTKKEQNLVLHIRADFEELKQKLTGVKE